MVIRVVFLLMFLSSLAISTVQANVIGDIDGDDKITLVEAVSALRVVGGLDTAAERKDEVFAGDYWFAEYGIERGGHGTEFGRIFSSGRGVALIEEYADSDGYIDTNFGLYTVDIDGSLGFGMQGGGVISGDGQLVAAIDNIPGNSEMILLFGFRKANDADESLLNGVYYVNSIGVDSDLANPDHWTQIIEAQFNGAGSMTYTVLANSGGGADTGSTTYAIESDGSLVIDGIGGGAVSPDGNVLMILDTDSSDDSLSIDIAVKSSTSATNALLSGTYIICEIGEDPDHWVGRIKVTFDGVSNFSWEQIYDSNGGNAMGTGTYSVAANGRITIDGVTKGIVSPDGQIFAMVDVDDTDDVLSLHVGVKMSDVP